MIKTQKQDFVFIEETQAPKLRDLLGNLAREGYDNITCYNEDNTGEIQIMIYDNFTAHLKGIADDLELEFEEDDELNKLDDYTRDDVTLLRELAHAIEDVPSNITSIYYDTY